MVEVVARGRLVKDAYLELVFINFRTTRRCLISSLGQRISPPMGGGWAEVRG